MLLVLVYWGRSPVPNRLFFFNIVQMYVPQSGVEQKFKQPVNVNVNVNVYVNRNVNLPLSGVEQKFK